MENNIIPNFSNNYTSNMTPEQVVSLMNAMAEVMRVYTEGCKTMLEMGYNLGMQMSSKKAVEALKILDVCNDVEG